MLGVVEGFLSYLGTGYNRDYVSKVTILLLGTALLFPSPSQTSSLPIREQTPSSILSVSEGVIFLVEPLVQYCISIQITSQSEGFKTWIRLHYENDHKSTVLSPSLYLNFGPDLTYRSGNIY